MGISRLRTAWNNLYIIGASFLHEEANVILKPKKLQGCPEGIFDLALGCNHAIFAVQCPNENGIIRSAGTNSCGQLGRDSARDMGLCEEISMLKFTNRAVVKIAAGREHSLVSLAEPDAPLRLFGFGANSLGQLGLPSSNGYLSPEEIPLPLLKGESVHELVCGLDSSYVLTSSGSIYGAGWNSDGQLGLGHCRDVVSSFSRIFTLPPVKKLVARADSCLALTASGSVYAWGNSEYAQCSTSDALDFVNSPCIITTGNDHIVDIAVGASFSLFLTNDGSILSCGYGPIIGGDQIGVPIRLSPTGLKFSQIYAGHHFALGVSIDDRVFLWGKLSSSQSRLSNMEQLDLPPGRKCIRIGWNSALINIES